MSKVIFEFNKQGVRASKFQSDKDKQIIFRLKGCQGLTSSHAGILILLNLMVLLSFVSPYQKPGWPSDIRVAIQLRDNVRSILEAVDNKLVLHIENRFGVFSQEKLEGKKVGKLGGKVSFSRKIHIPKSDSVEDILENLTQSGTKKYIGKRIHFDVKGATVSDLLKMIADASGFNIIIDDTVQKVPPLTLSLANIPWDQALDTILELSKLAATKNGNILIISTLTKARQEKKLQLEAEKILEVQEPLVTKIFPISYADSADLVKTLSEYTTKKRGAISVDQRTNQLIVKDTVEVIDRIKKILEVLDTQTPQVLIEAKLVEATEGFSQKDRI